MVYVICGFVLGFVVPYMARRFAKFSPASPSESLWRLIAPVRLVAREKRWKNLQYRELCINYFWRSFVYGCVTAVVFWLAAKHFHSLGIGGVLLFFWALILLTEIDYKTYLLPDVVTVPLLIGGFVFACFWGIWLVAAESAIGAVVGYVLPVIAGLLMAWKYPDAFGGGDVKLLAAVGAWLGAEGVIYVILLSCLFFGVFHYVTKKRVGAFGPAISLATIIVAFLIF